MYVYLYLYQPFDRLTVYDYRMECKGTAMLEQNAVGHGCFNIQAASSNAFTLCDPVTLTYDLILIGG